jgi:hypothetical protein
VAEHPSVLTGTFKRPFAEQLAFFRQKLGNLVPTARWDDLIGSAHDRAFMVAGATKADLLADLGAAVDRAISEGTTLEAFRKDFRAIVERNGWHGWTGESTAAGRAWRTRIIYRTNARTSYAAGRNAQLAEGGFPYLVYRHGGSLEPRPHHLSWDGMVLPADHPFWQTHSPPNGWGCSCYVVGARSEAGARRLGGDMSKQPPEGWDSVDPPGIDEGWDYRPGATVQHAVRNMAAKAVQWERELAHAFMAAVPQSVRDDLATSYRSLPSVADDVRRYAQRITQDWQSVEIQPTRTLGLLTSAQAERIGSLVGETVDQFDFSIDRSLVARAGVSPEAYGRLPAMLNAPDAIDLVNRGGRDLVRITKRLDAATVTALFERQAQSRTLALRDLTFQEVAP